MNAPETWLALLRVVVGAWVLKAVWTKLVLEFLWGVVPYPVVSERFLAFHPKRVAEFAAGNPVGWYKDFLETTVMPQSRLFATLQAYGEAAVGLGLVLGLLTGLTALVGLFMCVNFALAAQWMSFGQQGFHLLLVTSMVIFLFARSLVQGLPRDDRHAAEPPVRDAAGLRRGRGRPRARAGALDRPHRVGRALHVRELRPRGPVDELRPAGLPPPARDLDGDLSLRPISGTRTSSRRPSCRRAACSRRCRLTARPRSASGSCWGS